MHLLEGIRSQSNRLPPGMAKPTRDCIRLALPKSSPSAIWLSLLLFLFAPWSLAQTQSTYTITGATFGTPASQFIPAGIPGGTLNLMGTLPTAAQQAQSSLLACFYTGFGSPTGLPLSLPTPATTEPLTLPAAAVQSIPPTTFTTANNYLLTAYVYIVQSEQACDGTFDATLTNRYPITVVAPGLLTYSGPTSIPQTNPATSIQAAPTFLTLPFTGRIAYNPSGPVNPQVTFGSFGSVQSTLSGTSLNVAVPPAFSSSPAGTTTSLSICNTFGTTSLCTSPTSAITLTVASLYPSAGTLTPTPSPATTSDQTILTAQFARGAVTSPLPEPGAPSGIVTFSTGASTTSTARLILDPTATFVPQTSTISTPVTATPTIAPIAGNYLNSTAVSIADATPGATIFYTQDGTTPTTASTPYIAPLTITASQTVQAIAAASGLLNSAIASSAYTITISPPTKLAFTVQPVSTAAGAPISPAVQVALQDINGTVVNTSTLPVTIALAANPAQSVLSGTTTVNAVNGIATFADLNLNNIATGYTLTATSGSLTPATSSAFNITAIPITMTVQSALVGINSTLTGTIKLGSPAPQAGTVLALASDTPGNVTIAPSTLTIPAGQTTGTFTYSGVTAGPATLSASATNYVTGSTTVNATAAQVSLGTIPAVAPGQSVSLALSLPTAAPPGGTTVTFTSSNTGVATITSSVTVPAGQRTAATNPQITGVIIGNTVITANAPGFAPDTRNVNVTVVASINPYTTNLNLITSTNTTLNLAAPAPTGGIAFTLTSDDPTIATIASPVTVAAGATSVPIRITGVGNGSTTIRADSPGVTEATGAVNINSAISVPAITTGNKMQYGFNLYLPVNPSVPTTVTLSITDPTIGTISNSTSTVGTKTITIPNVTSSYIGYFVLQGQSLGTTTLSVSAPGYTTGTGSMVVSPSGFAFYPYVYYDDFSTTTFSSPNTITVYTTYFDAATGNYLGLQLALNPGIADINVPVTSGTPSVGTIVTSPVVFHAGSSQASTTFQPASAGTSTLTVGTPPAPFSVPNYYQTSVATVTTPAIQAFSTYTGVKQQNYQYVYLPVAPPNPITVTITSNNPGLVLLSKDPTIAGTSTITFPSTAGSAIGYIYLQGQGAGSATLTISAPGYTSSTDTITVYPSGFSYYIYYGDQSFSTLTTYQPTNITVYTATLDPTSLQPNGISLALSPGVAAVSVPVTSATTTVGTLSPASLTFSPGDTQHTTAFTPVGAGTSVISITTPAGYTTPSTYQSLTATVTAPTRIITIQNDVTVGSNLEGSVAIYLSNTPASPLTVTVTSNNPSVATVSNAQVTVGTTSTTFTNVTSTYVGTVYIQGQAQGATTLTASATGYTSGTDNITVNPSGFSFFPYVGSFSTTTFSAASGISVYPVYLDPSSLNPISYPQTLNPGLPNINVPLTSSAPSVGTIATSPLVFAPQSYYASTTFQPISAGVSTISIGTPAGFSTPAIYTAITATVTAPTISVGNVETGLQLETSMNIYLPQTPPNPVTVTVTSNGPQIAILSKDGTLVGGTTLTFTNVTSTNVGTIYIQGASLGTTTITVSAPGYNNGNGNVTIDPSGFSLVYQGDFTTSVTSNQYGLTVYPVSLTPGTLTQINYGFLLAPGAGNISVPVTSSNPATGTIITSPVVFIPGGLYYQPTTFKPVATGTTVITVQPPAGFSTPSQYQTINATVQ